jgi:very-short-patch-repair endonuclease
VPTELEGWVTPSEGREPPGPYETRPIGEVEERFDNDDHRVAAWARFRTAWEEWAIEDERREELARVYARLFETERLLEREGERLELLLAVGLLSWRRPHGVVRRHLLVTEGRIDLDRDSGRLIIGPATGVTESVFEEDMLDLGDRLRVDSSDDLAREARAVTNVLDPDEVRPLLERCATELAADGAYGEDTRAPQAPTEAPRVHFAPALVVRARGERSLIAAYQSVIDDLANGVSPAVQGLIEPLDDALESNGAESSGYLSAGLNSDGDDHYLPLLANEQQREIVRRLGRRRGVVVQGPPGTGKSHTIANLIADLLARGQRILVTAQTARALEVLKDKLPPEIAELCVSVLGDSREAQTRLDASVQGILRRRAVYDDARSEREIARLAQRRAELLALRAELHREVVAMREAEDAHVDLGGGYAGRPAHVADRLAREAEAFGWLTAADTSTAPLTNSEALELLGLLRRVGAPERERAARARPPLAHMPTPAEFDDQVEVEGRAALRGDQEAAEERSRIEELEAEEHRLRGLAEQARTAVPGGSRPSAEVTELIDGLLGDVEARLRRMESVDFDWVPAATEDALRGRLGPWVQRSTQAEEMLAEAPQALAACTGRRLSGVEGRALPPLIAQAEGLRGHFARGGKLRAFLRTPDPVRRAAELLEHVRLDGSPPDDLATVELTIAALQAADSVARASFAWRGATPSGAEYPAADAARLKAELHELVELTSLQDQARNLRAALERAPELGARAYGTADERAALRMRLLEALGATRLEGEAAKAEADHAAAKATLVQAHSDARRRAAARLERMTELQKRRLLLKRALDDMRAPRDPILDALSVAVGGCDMSRYRELREELAGVEALATAVARLDHLLARLAGGSARELSDEIQDSATDAVWDERLAVFEEAWAWRSADNALAKLTDPVRRRQLEGELTRTEDGLRQVVTILAAERAWSRAFARMTSHEQQHLGAYAESLRRLGKGTGKYASTRRRQAQEHLDQCQAAIPAWIMPLYRVAQTIPPRRDRFDVVIVDEASQAGIDALLLFHLAPKIVVVGDDQQISPENVGVDRADVEALQRRHLAGFSLASQFDADTSLFAQAHIRFPGRVVLQEHFRCMPEIIGFSNDLCYRELGLPLVQLRQFGADRLPPLRSIHVPDGYREGEGSSTRNPLEAEALVHELCRCLADPSYSGKSFGIVSLLGPGQAKLIEQLIRERVDAATILDRQIRVGDAYAFQGDERDVMFLSLVATKEPGRRLIAMTDGRSRRRFNVAASRARDQLILVHSVLPDDLSPECVRHKLLRHVLSPPQAEFMRGPNASGLDDEVLRPPFESIFEQRVYRRIVARGYHVVPQYDVAGFRIDLVVVGEKGMLAVECDGDIFHTAENHEHDLARERELTRCGWTFFRVRGSAFFRDPDSALGELWPLLARMGIEPSDSGGGPSGRRTMPDRQTSMPSARPPQPAAAPPRVQAPRTSLDGDRPSPQSALASKWTRPSGPTIDTQRQLFEPNDVAMRVPVSAPAETTTSPSEGVERPPAAPKNQGRAPTPSLRPSAPKALASYTPFDFAAAAGRRAFPDPREIEPSWVSWRLG